MNRAQSTAFPSLALATLSALALGLASGVAVHALLRRPHPAPIAAQPGAAQPPAIVTSTHPSSVTSAAAACNPAYPIGQIMTPPCQPTAPTLNHDSPRWSQLGLTYAEIRVAQRIVKGRSFSSIASELGVTDQSVRKTASRIYRKAGVGRRQDFTAQMGAPTAVSPSAPSAIPAASPAFPIGVMPASTAGSATASPGSTPASSAATSVAPSTPVASSPLPYIRCSTSSPAQTPHGNIPSTRNQ